MKRKIILALLFAFLLFGCEKQTVQEAPRDPQAKYFDGKGKVTKINLEIGSVELDHEEIKGLMPKMIMEFYVRDATQLKNLKIGDAVDFTVEDKSGAERIFNIRKSDK